MKKTVSKTRHGRSALIIAALAFSFTCCATSSVPNTHNAASYRPAVAVTRVAGKAQSNAENTDCFVISTLPEKRACFAKQSDDTINECERLRPLTCKSYRDMYFAEQALDVAQKALLASVHTAYSSYTSGDPGYLNDLSAYSHIADTAWRAYRDAQCLFEPFVQGMSRSEAEGVAEVCRLSMTEARITQLKALAAASAE